MANILEFILKIMGSRERVLNRGVIAIYMLNRSLWLQYENRLYQGDYLESYYSISGERFGIE